MAAGGTAWHTGWPVAVQLGIAWAEFAAGMAILLGLRCRLAAALALLLTAGLPLWGQGWKVFSLPFGALEMTLLLLLTGLALLFLGAGQLSLDGRGGARAVRRK
jgi:uncharacterized membrane protein YphA (DoxX/SURF4 family)